MSTFRSLLPLAGVVLASCLVACGGGGGGGGGGENPPVTGSITFTSCDIPAGEASCDGSIGWTTRNATAVRITLDGQTLGEGPSGNIDLALPGAFVDVVLSDGGVVLDTLTFRGVCESASAWDGERCTVFAERLDTRVPTPFLENGQPVELEMVIFKPAGEGPFPTAIYHHGSTGNGSDPSLFTITVIDENVAKFFNDRGWLVAFPQRRGRGQSDGLYDEGFTDDRSGYSCRADRALVGAERAIADLDVVLDWMRNRSDVDPSRVLNAGASRGGILAINHTARRADALLGAVNFVGGWVGEGCGDHRQINRTLFEGGASFPDDTIWLYANNDSFYSVDYSRGNFDAFTAAGGLGSFFVYTRPPGLNGHFLTFSPDLWSDDLAAYLDALP